MSSMQASSERAAESAGPATVDAKLEVVVIPVSDVERAKRFYQGLGWRVDADFAAGDDWRLVQITPSGSACSIMFGKGFTTATPGSAQGTFLIVDDIASARAELVSRGADVSELFHFTGALRVSGTDGRAPGPDPQGKSYGTWASFSDPDGNSFLLQEVKTRLPGRGFSSLDAATLTEFLRDAEQRHGSYEATSPPVHHWSDWYAGYIAARERGKTPEEAAEAAARRIEGSSRASS
jgi:catechol 2,3-dioxygenase-like lactoylglutathione lyase family enzyme